MASFAILQRARELREEKDARKAALLVQSGWIIIEAAFQEDGILWVLMRE